MDKTSIAVTATVIAGGFIALQAPINAGLGKAVGSIPAASISFAIGTAALVAITLLVGGGYGKVGEIGGLPWHYLLGGLLGAVYVTTALVAVQTLGAGGVTGATIAGQLAMSVVLDRIGVFGLEQRELSPLRLLGVGLLAVGTILVVRE